MFLQIQINIKNVLHPISAVLEIMLTLESRSLSNKQNEEFFMLCAT